MTAREKLLEFVLEDLIENYRPDYMAKVNQLIDSVIQEALQTRIDAFKDNQPTETTLTATSAQINKENEQKDSARYKFIFSMVSYIQQVSMPWLREELIKSLGGIHAVVEEARLEGVKLCQSNHDPKIDEVNRAILALQEAQATAWISVDARLPEHDNPVLVYAKFSNTKGFVIKARYTEGHDGQRYWRQEISPGLIVTHWQELPQPPKEGEAL